jgi:hypothetical protein
MLLSINITADSNDLPALVAMLTAARGCSTTPVVEFVAPPPPKPAPAGDPVAAVDKALVQEGPFTRTDAPAPAKRGPGRPRKVTAAPAAPAAASAPTPAPVTVSPEALAAAQQTFKAFFVPLATEWGEKPFIECFKAVGAASISKLASLEQVTSLTELVNSKVKELQENEGEEQEAE